MIEMLRHVSFNGSVNGLSTQWTIGEGRCALVAADEMSARQEDNSDLFVHTNLAGTLLFQATIFTLQIWKLKNKTLVFV